MLKLYVYADIAIKRFMERLSESEGQTLAEYALIAGVILAIVAGLVYKFGGNVAQLWHKAIKATR